VANAVSIRGLEDAIYSWVKARVSVKTNIIFEKENAPRPPNPLVSINLITGPIKYGHDEIIRIDDTSYKSDGHRKITASIKSYGVDYLQVMTDLQASLNLLSVRDIFRSKNISFLHADDIKDISAKIETGFENRAVLDVFFGLRTSLVEEVEYIESAEIDPTIENPEEEDLGLPPFTVTGI